MDRDAVRQRLLEERERLSAVATELAEDNELDSSEQASLGELSSFDQHQADLGTETFEREKDLSLIAGMEDEISEIDAALERLEDGTYGKCEACGKPIGDERLEAVPAARFCIEDQNAREGQ